MVIKRLSSTRVSRRSGRANKRYSRRWIEVRPKPVPFLGREVSGSNGLLDFDADIVVLEAGADRDGDGFGGIVESKFNGIFDNGLEEHRGQAIFEAFRVVVELSAEAMAEADFFDLQVQFEVLQLFGEGYPLLVFFPEVAAEEVGELLDHLAGLFGPAADEGADGVEAVEQKVGRELLAELEELGLFGQAFGVVAALAVLLFLFGEYQRTLRMHIQPIWRKAKSNRTAQDREKKMA